MDARRHSARRRRGRVAGCARAVVGHLRAAAERRQGAAQLPDLRRRLLQHALQHADADYAGERQEPEPRVGVSSGGHRKLAADAARGRRHHVPDAAAERRHRAGCHDRPRVLDLSLHATRTSSRAADRTIAAWRYSASCSTWARSTATSSPSTREAAGRSGRRESPTARRDIRSPSRRSR